jgi:aryl-alcohol dehydrogenase-like predicted oxidoreductase
MEYRPLKGSDFAVSRVALGTWPLGGSHWDGYDEGRAVEAIETALDCGVNFIDTAPVYGAGHSEELIGKVIRGRREKIFLATKCGLDIYSGGYGRDLSPAYIEKDLTNSLRRLGTEYIDLYQCHWPDPRTPVAGTMEALERFREQGKIRHIGVSNFSDAGLREAARHARLFSTQSQYSLLERRIEKDILPTCREQGINVLAYGPLGAGMLTGKYGECPTFSKGDARSFFYRFFKRRYWPGVCRLVDAVAAVARSKGVPPGAVALSWVLAREGVGAALVGARSAEQVRENTAHVPVAIEEGEMALLDRLSAEVYEG